MSTGNFRFNIPVLEIPGPEGSFELPLHYRAGIGLNQEASWVGLGWSMNAGAITRTVNQFPDDANGEPMALINKNPGRRGWYMRQGIVNMGWDSQDGHVGNVDIGIATVGWKNGLNSGSLAGIGYQNGKGMTFDPMRFTMAIMTVATAGTAGSVSHAMGFQATGTGIAGKAAAIGVETAFSSAVGIGVAQVANALHSPTSKAGGYMRVAERNEKKGFSFWSYTNYWMFIDNSNTQKMYGPLYFRNLGAGASPTAPERQFGPDMYKGVGATTSQKPTVFYVDDRPSNKSTSYRMEEAADISLPIDPFDSYHNNSMRPISVAYDAFTVMGPGIGGNIRPYRLDVGSVAFPRQMNEEHFKYNLVPFSQTKPEFIYEGSASNTYEHHQGTGANKDRLGITQQWSGKGALTLQDPLLYDNAARTAPNRYGLNNGQLAQGRQVHWFTNEEIAQEGNKAPAAQGKFLDFAKPESYRVNQRILIGYINPCGSNRCDERPIPQFQDNWVTVPNRFRAGLPAKGIGAFVITAEDGTRYHFALPVYHYGQHSKSWNINNPAEYTSERMGLANSGYAYATAWLLTAITGPDFVDKGTIGVLDAEDEGRWIKFEYGKFSSQFKWRTPYRSNAIIDNGYSVLPDGSPAPTYGAYSEGYKETYYLNSISTRSHTAIFVKDVRLDGRGHYTGSTARNPDLDIEEKEPASSLRLNEIILLTNEDYQRLQTEYGFGTNTANNAAERNAALLSAHDSFEKVFDPADLSSNTAARSYLEQKLIKRVVFNYTYRLCPKTSNSFASAKAAPQSGASNLQSQLKGKLTLESVALLGPNNAKLIPDFKFEYGFNPIYDEHKYDAYGFYKRERTQNGSLFVNNDMVSVNAKGQTQASEDGSAWSLKRLHNPLGSTLEVEYERDQYASVSGLESTRVIFKDKGSSYGPSGIFTGGPEGFDLRTRFKKGDVLHIKGRLNNRYRVPSSSPSGGYTTVYCATDYEKDHIIADVTERTLQISQPPTALGAPYPGGPVPAGLAQCNPSIHVPTNSYEGFEEFTFETNLSVSKNGGDIRVAKLLVRNEKGNTQQTKYQYSSCSSQGCFSTGVISKEPEKAKHLPKAEYITHTELSDPDYPATPVLYSEVTELSGRFRNAAGEVDDNAFDTRTVYSFHTPRLDMISQTKVDSEHLTAETANYPHYITQGNLGELKLAKVGLSMANNLTRINTALIGQPKWVRSFDKRGTMEREVVYNYTNDIENDAGIAHQGYFSEGSLLSEITKSTDNSEARWFSVNKSIKTVIPTYLIGTTTISNGIQTSSRTLSYDFLTAAPLSSKTIDALGVQFRNTQVPAYKIPGYEGMGSVGFSASNKNMLSQIAASSVSKVLPDGSLAPVAASVATWRRDWATYRKLDAATDQYVEFAAPTKDRVWRMHRSFAWQGKQLNPDGTLAGFIPFNWTSPTASGQNAGWIQQGEITHYDQFSRPLQSKDINGSAAAEKSGYNQKYSIASAVNARYTEIAYSGAEDQYPTSNGTHFGGEVRDAGRRNSDQKHTGLYSSLLTAGQLGFTYKATVGNTKDISTDRNYRASVWVYDNSDAQGARLYLALDGTTVKEMSIADAATKRAGKWLLLHLFVKIPNSDAGKQLTVGCRNAGSGSVYVDDFRFHPVDAPLTAYVYDGHTGQMTYTLDNDNLYTEYEYDAAGKLARVYKEILTKPGSTAGAERRIVKESQYNYAQMKAPTWVETENIRCKMNPDNSPTGQQEKEEKDVNSASPTYGQTRWVVLGASLECATCTADERWIVDHCEKPTIECESSTQLGTNKYLNVYRYSYSDGHEFTRDEIEAAPCVQ
ncbi:hypothetical protein [Hymenobacter weizhouensis]|uniref:hypothetical protein n=1 Tax=Hymenobacter sp. YIM 151500-1 TaxID=2987689 RepID=UPI002225C6B1|nr:hypothetical protein [Hymenobacter sp. YIM 151500-1]UYZ62534.1 hypothetical protein OIS53_16230 [Hymenobacter sp. YIM 151500-1]